jgi:glycerol-3-phosphate dehydrogenase (NAD+)
VSVWRQVTILLRSEDEAKSINTTHKTPKYLKEYTLHDNISASCDAKTALTGVTLIVHAIPVQASLAYVL